eukprot:391217_1
MALFLLITFIIAIVDANVRHHALIKRHSKATNQYYLINNPHHRLKKKHHSYRQHIYRDTDYNLYKYNANDVKYGEALHGDIVEESNKSQQTAFMLSLFFFGA